MIFRLIAKNLRLTSGTSGALLATDLDAIWGGHTMKQANFMMVPLQKSSTSAKVGLKLRHGPDGKNFVDHSTPIASTALGAAVEVLSGDSDGTKMLGEVLLPVATCEGNGSDEWAMVNVYIVAKPF